MIGSDKEHCRITVKGKTKMEDVKQSILSTDSVNACLRVRSLQRDNDSRRAVEADNDENKGSVRVVSGSGFRYVVPFPWRLHQMLEDIEKSGGDSIVSWLPDGHHFQVHNPQLFMQRIIPKFFKQKSYKSFQRQLHLYGFHRVLEGQNRGKKRLALLLFIIIALCQLTFVVPCLRCLLPRELRTRKPQIGS